MSHQQDLARFLENKVKEKESDADHTITEDTELLTSGLISSLALLELAEWIESHLTSPIDLTTINPKKEWNTIKDILNFIDRHSTKQND